MDILIVTFMIFIMPIEYLAMKQDYIIETTITNQTALFTDTVRNKGYVDYEMYNQFSKWLSQTGNVYDIEIIHYKKIYNYDADSKEYIMDYEYCSNETIVDKVLGDAKIYYMELGDFVSVKVTNKSETVGEKIQRILVGTKASKGVNVIYGGVIRDETY